MMSQTLILFIILLLSLILCSFLGGYNCSNVTEGYTENHNGPYGGKVTSVTGVRGNTEGSIIGNNRKYKELFTGNTSTNGGSITQSTYYAKNGSSATVTKVKDTYRIAITKKNGKIKYYSYTPPTSSNTTDDSAIQGSTFAGPYGTTARVITNNNGRFIIEVTYSCWKKIFYAENGEQFNNYSGDDGYYDQDEYDMDDMDDNDSGSDSENEDDDGDDYGSNGTNTTSYYGPNGGQIRYIQVPGGNTLISTNNNNINPEDYYNSLPQGISANMIPPGQEDLYILKSQVVPPVCPACPSSSSTTCPREEPCPSCPPCGRCPEPSFECKKVPNYNSNGNDYLPMPVLNDFTTFGM